MTPTEALAALQSAREKLATTGGAYAANKAPFAAVEAASDALHDLILQHRNVPGFLEVIASAYVDLQTSRVVFHR